MQPLPKPALIPGIRGCGLPKSVRPTEESRFFRWIAGEQPTHTRRTYELLCPTTGIAPHSRECWATNNRNYLAAPHHSAGASARSPRADLHACLAALVSATATQSLGSGVYSFLYYVIALTHSCQFESKGDTRQNRHVFPFTDLP